jgi:phage/plasmid-like protein (TIGR03299 family)
MAHQIDTTSIGRASYASTQREWHWLGQLMPAGQSVEQWQEAAGMTYKVQRAYPRFATERIDNHVPATSLTVYDERVILFRSDTGAPLGCVSPKYKVVQPREVLEFFSEWAAAGGMTIESAGVLFGGKRYFATAKLADGVFVDGTRDKIVPYALLSTSADGTLATEARWTSVRVVCNNTLRLATKDSAVFKLSHRSEWKPEVARDTIEAAQAEFGAFMSTARKLAGVRVEAKLAQEMTALLLRKGTEEADKTKESAGFTKIMSLFEGGGKGSTLETSRETAFGWLNACTEYYDHHIRAHSDENRTASALWGVGDDMKQRALEIALAA